jgi:hypothetical protein
MSTSSKDGKKKELKQDQKAQEAQGRWRKLTSFSAMLSTTAR